MKVGIELKIDVTKINKAKLYQGQKGKYLTMTAFVDLDQADQFGNNGMVKHKTNQGEQDDTILGNSRVFWRDDQQTTASPQQQVQQQQVNPQYQSGFNQQPNPNQAPKVNPQEPSIDFDESIPFIRLGVNPMWYLVS